MRKKSKTLVVFLVAIVLMLGGVHVYASSALDTNLINLIRLIFDDSINDFDQTIHNETQKLVNKKKDIFDSYIDLATGRVIGNIEDFIDLEVDRASGELNAYMAELIEQMNGIMEEEEERLREIVTNYMNESINVLKSQIYSHLYTALDEHLLDKVTPTP